MRPTTWDPALYEGFADHRIRPGIDLLNGIPVSDAEVVYDLGCGSGRLTAALAGRWPTARIVGIDSSPEMLSIAEPHPRIEFVLEDISTWLSESPADVIYSNAALHWLEQHEVLFPHLLRQLRPGGVLAVQMPDNFAEPTHDAIRRVATSPPFRANLRHLAPRFPVADPAAYRRILSGAATVDQWETVYHQELTGPDPVLRWTMGTIMRPLLEALSDLERAEFIGQVGTLYRDAYPPQPDGTTILPFRRRFIVAVRV